MKINWEKNKLKIFALYELIISGIVIISTFTFFFHFSDFLSKGYWGSTILIAILGIIAGVLLINRKKAGLYLSMVWSFLQIFNIYLNGLVLDLTQILTLDITINWRPTYDFVIAFNLLGVLFLILLIFWRRELK